MACSYRCGPTATMSNRTSWGPVTSVDPKSFDRPLSGNYDRIFNAFDRTNAFEYVKNNFEEGKEERQVGHTEIVVNRKMSSSFERADSSLATQSPCSEDEDYYREKILYSQARQLFPLQEDLADWINKTIGITYLTGENFLEMLDNGVELCQLASVIHERAREALDQGLIVGPVASIRGRCWQRAARRSFFSRDNTDNFISFCRDMGVHENLLFESDDLVLHKCPRQVVVCLLELARRAARAGVDPPALVQLEREIAREEEAPIHDLWQFQQCDGTDGLMEAPPSSPNNNNNNNNNGLEPSTDNNDDARSEGTDSVDSDVPLKPTNELDKRVELVSRLVQRACRCEEGRCARLLTVRKLGEGKYNIAGRNVFIRLLKGRHMMVRVGGGWDTLEHFLSRHEPCQVRLVSARSKQLLPLHPSTPGTTTPPNRTKKPSTPTPKPAEPKKSLPTPKKSKSLNLAKEKSPTPKKSDSEKLRLKTENLPKKTRSQSLASTPVENKSFCGSDKLVGRKARSVSLVPGSPELTQAAIEESIRLSLSGEQLHGNKPFLHIKAKYRSPPPR